MTQNSYSSRAPGGVLMAGALNTGQGTLRPAYLTNYGEAMTPGGNNAAVNVFL